MEYSTSVSPGFAVYGRQADHTLDEKLTPEILCERHASQVYRFAAMVARDAVEAEDIAQEALERAIRRIDQLDLSRGAAASWLWRIVVNAAHDAGRLRARRQAVWSRLVGRRLVDDVPAHVEVEALARLTNEDLLRQVRALPSRDRAVLALRFGADLDFAAVGAALGVSAGAAAAATHRALEKLRAQLDEDI